MWIFLGTGGSVKGRKILGQYPDDLTDDGPLTLSRGETFFLQIIKK